MLLAPDDSTQPARSRSLESDVLFNYMLIAGITGLVVYTLILGIGLMSGNVPVERAYALMSVPPFVTAGWQIYGFWRQPGASGSVGEMGLLLAGLGWLAVGAALLAMHSAVASGLAANQPINQIGTPAIAWIFSLLGVALIVGGAILSWGRWQQQMRSSDSM